jgi:hypothetical protein
MMPRKTARRWRRLERARALWAPTSLVAIVATPEVDRAPRPSVPVVCGDAMASLRPLSSEPGGTGPVPPVRRQPPRPDVGHSRTHSLAAST